MAVTTGFGIETTVNVTGTVTAAIAFGDATIMLAL